MCAVKTRCCHAASLLHLNAPHCLGTNPAWIAALSCSTRCIKIRGVCALKSLSPHSRYENLQHANADESRAHPLVTLSCSHPISKMCCMIALEKFFQRNSERSNSLNMSWEAVNLRWVDEICAKLSDWKLSFVELLLKLHKSKTLSKRENWLANCQGKDSSQRDLCRQILICRTKEFRLNYEVLNDRSIFLI